MANEKLNFDITINDKGSLKTLRQLQGSLKSFNKEMEIANKTADKLSNSFVKLVKNSKKVKDATKDASKDVLKKPRSQANDDKRRERQRIAIANAEAKRIGVILNLSKQEMALADKRSEKLLVANKHVAKMEQLLGRVKERQKTINDEGVQLNIEIARAQIKRLRKEMKSLDKTVLGRGVGKVNKGWKTMADLVKKTGNVIGFLAKPLKIIGGIVVVINQGVQLLTASFQGLRTLINSSFGELIKTNAEFENYLVRLKVVTGTQAEAGRVFGDVQNFAQTVTFTFRELISGATKLMPLLSGGRKELNSWLPIISDIAATTGLTFDETVSNFIKAIKAGIASADLFRERGITAMLGFTPGVRYTPEETIAGIRRAYLSEASVFRGAANELATTWDGIISMIIDRWDKFVKMVGDAGAFDQLKNIINAVKIQWDRAFDTGSAEKWAKKISQIMVSTVILILEAIKSLTDSISWMLDVFSPSKEKLVAQKKEILATQEGTFLGKKALFDKSMFEQTDKLFGTKMATTSEEQKASLKKIETDLKVVDASEKLQSNINNLNGHLEDFLNIVIDAAQPKAIDRRNIMSTGEIESVEGWKQLYREEGVKRANIEARRGNILQALAPVQERLEQKIIESRVDIIKKSQGVFASTIASIAAQEQKEFDKARKQLEDKGLYIAKTTIDPITGGKTTVVDEELRGQIRGKTGALKRAQISNELAKESISLTNKRNQAVEQLKNVGLSDYQQNLNKIEAEYAKIVKNASWSVDGLTKKEQKQAEANRRVAEETKAAKIALLDKNKVLQDNSLQTQRSYDLQIAQLNSNRTYQAQLLEINKNLEAQSKLYSEDAEKLKELTKEQKHQIKLLNTQALVNYSEQLKQVNRDIALLLADPTQREEMQNAFDLEKLKSELVDLKAAGSPAADTLERLIAARQKLNELNKTPQTALEGFKAGLRTLSESIKTEGEVVKSLTEDVANSMASSFTTLFTDVLKGDIKDMGTYFKQFLNGLLQSFQKALSDMLSSYLLKQFINTFGQMSSTGGGGGNTSAGGFLSDGGSYGGGVASDSIVSRSAILQPTRASLSQNTMVRPNITMQVEINGGDAESVKKALPYLEEVAVKAVQNDIAQNGDTNTMIREYTMGR